MKKTLATALAIITLLSLCSCGINIGKKEEPTTEHTTTQPFSFVYTTQPEVTQGVEIETQTPAQQENTPTQADTPTNSAPEATTQRITTFYTDNPSNRYIAAVADRYGVDRSCLVAFIRTDSSEPGANVLQFRGSKDQYGRLITTADELVYVYDVLDNGKFRKTNRDASDMEGYDNIPVASWLKDRAAAAAAKAEYMLVEQQILPNIEKYKSDSRYRYEG